LIDNHNSFRKQHKIFVPAVVTLLLICCFNDITSASANTSDSNIYNTCDIDQFAYDERQPEKLKLDALKKRLNKKIENTPLFGISFIPKGFYFISIFSPLLFESDLWKPENISETAIESSFLPVSIPEVDKYPYFQSVHLSNAASLSERICFTGTVKDELRLKNIKVVVRTPTGSSFEILNAPISGCSIDLSEFCIDGIYDLHTVKEGDYKVVLAVKDSANQVISKTFFIAVPPRSGCQQDLHGGQCVNYVRNFFGGRYDLMPGLCIYPDCAAYHAWETWDLGYGKGLMPADKSILIMDKGSLLFGHMAVVMDHKRNADNTYTLTVHESNWDRDELIDCNVRYTYFPGTFKVIREGRRKSYDVAGFIYSDNVYSQKDIPPEYENAVLPNLVTYPNKVYFGGLARDDVGLKEIKIEVSGPRGKRLPVFKGMINGLSKDLSDLWFDSSNREYAGIAGHYIVKLIIIDTMDQKHSRIFPVLVNKLN